MVRIAIYKSRNGQRTGRALYVTTRAARAGLLNVTLRSRSLLRKLRAGTYVMEVRSGQSARLARRRPPDHVHGHALADTTHGSQDTNQMAMLPVQAPSDRGPIAEIRPRLGGTARRGLAGRSDESLVAVAKEGDERAFEILYERHSPAILRYCRSLLRSTQEAEDVKQEVFVLAISALRRGAEPDAFRPWLYRVAHNACMSHLRIRRPVLVADNGVLVGPAGAAEPVDGHREELRQLLDDIGKLPDVQRGALLLREMDGFSYEQVGEVLGLPLSTVRASIFRARRTLQGLAEARDADCEAIQSELCRLADRRGRRGRHITTHLHVCVTCRDFRDGLRRRPAVLGGVQPAAPFGSGGLLLALKGKLLGGAAAGGAGAALATGGGGAGVAKFAAVAASSIALLAGAGVQADRVIDHSRREAAAAKGHVATAARRPHRATPRAVTAAAGAERARRPVPSRRPAPTPPCARAAWPGHRPAAPHGRRGRARARAREPALGHVHRHARPRGSPCDGPGRRAAVRVRVRPRGRRPIARWGRRRAPAGATRTAAPSGTTAPPGATTRTPRARAERPTRRAATGAPATSAAPNRPTTARRVRARATPAARRRPPRPTTPRRPRRARRPSTPRRHTTARAGPRPERRRHGPRRRLERAGSGADAGPDAHAADRSGAAARSARGSGAHRHDEHHHAARRHRDGGSGACTLGTPDQGPRPQSPLLGIDCMQDPADTHASHRKETRTRVGPGGFLGGQGKMTRPGGLHEQRYRCAHWGAFSSSAHARPRVCART